MKQPIVIFGGFLTFTSLYCGLYEALQTITGLPVSIVETQSLDWITAVVAPGWRHLLGKLERTVHKAVKQSETGKVTLVAHSAGGILARIYLSPKAFFGHAYCGLDHVSHLITLGSPHDAGRKFRYGGLMSRWANQHYPGAFFSPQVTYIAVAGKAIRGDPQGSQRERQVYKWYRDMTGEGAVWGDGIVPVTSALLRGAVPIVLEDVGHFAGFGPSWYGDVDVVRRWWTAMDDNERDLNASTSEVIYTDAVV